MSLYRKIFLAATALFLSAETANAQQNIYEWFDSDVATENSQLHNGPIYYNQYRSRDVANTPFLGSDEFTTGDVFYDGQPFYKVALKYDIHRDILLAQPYEGENFKSIHLIQPRTESFVLLGRRFVNLNYNNAKTPNFIKGYYEENLISEKFTFYIKHHKSVREIIHSQALYSDFSSDNTYYVFMNDTYHPVKSKNSVVKLFPAYKAEIGKYFSANSKSAETQFMEGLFKYLNTISK